jgi:tetratricopeptide (TPR) repeat protein
MQLPGYLARATQALDEALRRYPLDRIPAVDRPWLALAGADALAGRSARVRATVDRWARDVPPERRSQDYKVALALVLAAERHPAEARAAYQAVAESLGCNACVEPWIAQAWDAQGVPDSALAHLERYLSTPDLLRMQWDPHWRPSVLRRAGELAAQLGRRQQAIERYSQFVELWKVADPDLQPVVKDVRARIAKLTAQGG